LAEIASEGRQGGVVPRIAFVACLLAVPTISGFAAAAFLIYFLLAGPEEPYQVSQYWFWASLSTGAFLTPLLLAATVRLAKRRRMGVRLRLPSWMSTLLFWSAFGGVSTFGYLQYWNAVQWVYVQFNVVMIGVILAILATFGGIVAVLDWIGKATEQYDNGHENG
jgi:hypothetical protein